MKLNDKVKLFRENKRLSQESIAFELGLSQSQYSRRESGNIKFNSDEVLKLTKILEVSLDNLFSDIIIVLNNNNQKSGVFGNNICIPEELISQYQLRIQEKDELILFLKEKIKYLEENK
jgi:transcriptional regulator with XRE-family HTH domain